MFKRQYIFSCQVAHNNGSGDKEYFNTALTTESLFKFSAEDLLKTARQIAVENLENRIDRTIKQEDIQVLALNRI